MRFKENQQDFIGLTEPIQMGKHKFNMHADFKFCGYTTGGFKLCSNDVEVTILKSGIEYTRFGAIQTKEDFASFIFGLTDVMYFSSIYHNGEKIAYAIYKPIFSSKHLQMTFLITSDKEIFAITFKTTPEIMESKHSYFLKWVKEISIEYDI